MPAHIRGVASAFVAVCIAIPAIACTGITLRSKDGAVIFGRTLEWGSFDLNSRLVIVPRGHKFKSLLDEGKTGLTWTARYGMAGVDAVEKDFVVDGMNEKGLSVNLFYHPGYAEYPDPAPESLQKSIGPLDVHSTCWRPVRTLRT